jgi:hypothetical protein
MSTQNNKDDVIASTLTVNSNKNFKNNIKIKLIRKNFKI